MSLRPAQRARAARGFTLIESMLAMVILVIAILAMFSMQAITRKTNRFGDRMVQASAMATDLEETIKRWSYGDSRLDPISTVSSLTDSAITSRWDMGRNTASSYTAEFSDLSPDSNASTAGALGTTYTGLSSDVDGDGQPDFTRYWNVWTVNFTGDPAEDGKLVQIIVRWKEPGLGYRQITATTFRRNPAKALQ